jgi:Protein of unknown function (DUF2891)
MASSSASRSPLRRTGLDLRTASRFARIALGHLSREYPNRLDHVLTGPADLKPPRALHPVFFGSFDWHSCVHSYWLLATLHRLYPDLPERHAIRTLFCASFAKDRIAGERAYLKRPSAGGFERPYGWAWLLMLQAELLRHKTPQAKPWVSALQPLAGDFIKRFQTYLPKATYPNRAGTHGNTAFALALAQEYATTAKDERLAESIRAAARGWYAKDLDCQAWEPSGEDFLSPALIEAVCMRAVLTPAAFRSWFARFLPQLAQQEPATLFAPAHISDRSDGRIVHLDGLNLSRAWCWLSIAESLAPDNPIRSLAARTADRHLAASLPFLTHHYMGEHWLASFALLALRPPPGRLTAPVSLRNAKG